MHTDTYTPVFATPLFVRQFRDADAFNATLAATVRELAARRKSHDTHRSHQGGFYTPGSFLEQDLPGVREVRDVFRAGMRAYIDKVAETGYGRIRPIPDDALDLHGWAALTRANDYQAPHVHAGANISAIYYVEVPRAPEPQGCIDLLNPLVLQEMTFIPGASTTHCRVVPEPGMLLVFPAYVRHTVHPFAGDAERIIVVCNCAVRWK